MRRLTGAVAHPVAFALVFALGGALFLGVCGGRRSGVPPDATIGVTYAVAAAVGILFIAKAKSGETHDICPQGNILGITRTDVYLLLAVSAPVLGLRSNAFQHAARVAIVRIQLQ